jgi:soluble lytic murein transglycosylase-like protein
LVRAIVATLPLLLIVAGFGLDGPAGRVAAEGARSATIEVFHLTSARRAFQALVRTRPSMSPGERIAAWTDFSLMLEAIVGSPSMRPVTFDEVVRLGRTGEPWVESVTPGLAARDRVAYQMLGLGYSARETADVVSGRISREALDAAWAMIAAGQGRDAAADFLDGQYARIEEARRRITARVRAWNGRPTLYDASILRHASRHGVDPLLVRAVMAAESGFDPAARSSAGAIGLMQLMPMTARELGVDPCVPEQNIEGGVRYLSQLLKTFGGVEMALVAYNAGPGFAQRYARGQTALYGETRVYVKNVLARLYGAGGAGG